MEKKVDCIEFLQQPGDLNKLPKGPQGGDLVIAVELNQKTGQIQIFTVGALLSPGILDALAQTLQMVLEQEQGSRIPGLEPLDPPVTTKH